MMGTSGASSSGRGSTAASSSASANPFGGMQGASAKEILAQSQAFFKEQQKLLQQLPPNSVQRKTYEAILAEMKQAAEQKYASKSDFQTISLRHFINFILFYHFPVQNMLLLRRPRRIVKVWNSNRSAMRRHRMHNRQAISVVRHVNKPKPFSNHNR